MSGWNVYDDEKVNRGNNMQASVQVECGRLTSARSAASKCGQLPASV